MVLFDLKFEVNFPRLCVGEFELWGECPRRKRSQLMTLVVDKIGDRYYILQESMYEII